MENIYAAVQIIDDRNKRAFKEKFEKENVVTAQVVAVVCREMRVNKDDTCNTRSRKRPLVLARQMVWAILRDHKKTMGLKRMGWIFGGYDHSCIIKGVAHIKPMIGPGGELAVQYNRVLEQLGLK